MAVPKPVRSWGLHELQAAPSGQVYAASGNLDMGALSVMTASHTDEIEALATNTSSHGYVDDDAIDMLVRDPGSGHR